MKRLLAVTLVCAIAPAFAAQAESKRQLDSHEHGHGTVNIAIEGTTVSMELEVPGADIVGFEHVAKTDADKASVEAAKATLEAPLKLFTLPGEANCKQSSAEVEVEEHNGHTEFHATYTLTCSAPDKINTITTTFFEQFPGAEELEVNLVSAKGQRQFELERSTPRFVLGTAS